MVQASKQALLSHKKQTKGVPRHCGQQHSSPRALEFATQGRAQAGRSDPQFQEVWPGHPDLPCDPTSVLHREAPYKESPSLKSISKVFKDFPKPDLPEAWLQDGHPECDWQMDLGLASKFPARNFNQKLAKPLNGFWTIGLRQI